MERSDPTKRASAVTLAETTLMFELDCWVAICPGTQVDPGAPCPAKMEKSISAGTSVVDGMALVSPVL
jgi:hypothetical protein